MNQLNKFKLVGDDPAASFYREFATLKALRQFQARNSSLKATPYILHESNWERFVIIGNHVLSKSLLENLLNSVTP